MPGMDGTGPFGNGPLGRGRGPCGGGRFSQYSRGWGRGFQRGGGFGQDNMNIPSSVDEVTILEQQKSWLESQIEVIKTRIANLLKSDSSGN